MVHRDGPARGLHPKGKRRPLTRPLRTAPDELTVGSPRLRAGFDHRLEIPRRSIAMMIAGIDEELHLQAERALIPRGLAPLRTIGDVHRIRAGLEPHPHLKLQIAAGEAPHGHPPVELKRLNVHMTLRIDHAVRPAVAE